MNFLRHRLRRWSYTFFLLCSPPVFSVEVSGLFETEIVANNQSAEAREIAIKQAFYAVLDRVVVADDISKIPFIQEMLLAADHYVKQSQFALLPASEYGETDARLFRVQFDEQQVMEALRNGRICIWSEIRPESLLWLIVDDNGDRQFYNADTMPEIESALAFAGGLKGVPLIYPLLDLEEQRKISVNDVLGADSGNLLAASARYEVPAVMAGRLFKKGECWQGEWAFYFDGKIKQWTNSCQSLKMAALAGVRGAYSVLGDYYGVKPESHNSPPQPHQ